MAIVDPSTPPIETTCSRPSSEVKYVVLTNLEPDAVASNENTVRIVGIPSAGRPSASTNESSTAKPFGSSISRNSHEPPAVSPRGLVMW